MLTTFVGGWLSDHVGRKSILLLTTSVGFVAALPLWWFMHHPSAEMARLGQLGLVLIVGLFQGTLSSAMVERAPPGVRCTAVALGYNVSLGAIGGLSPLMATWLVERTGNEVAPASLIMTTAVISFLVILQMAETRRAPFANATAIASDDGCIRGALP